MGGRKTGICRAYFISRQDLIAAKRASARLQGIADVDAIEKAAESRGQKSDQKTRE
jgi:hypothetical protein